MTQNILPLSRMNRAAPTPFALEPNADTRAEIATELGLRSLRKLRFEGQLHPEGKRDWRLEATLGATAIQDCVVTLEPVTTRIDTTLSRRFVTQMPQPTGEEMEMPEDDSIEPLPDQLDLMDVLTEALSLALPDFPRAEGVELGQAIFAAPGIAPMTDEDAKPLAGLAALRDKLADPGNEGENND